MRCDALYLSPHLDDAVLSCAARIQQEADKGHRIVVATLFTEAGCHGAAHYRRRRAEDVRAAEALGAAALHLGLTDAPFRRPYYSSFRAIVFGSHPADPEDEDRVRRALETVFATCVPRHIYCPLGVGTHIDHRLVFRAAIAVRGIDGLTFYEDRPYGLVPGQLAIRLAELSLKGDVPMVGPTEFLKGLREAPYVRAYLAESERSECETLLTQRLPTALGGRQMRPETVASERVEDILSAIALYETQLADLYGDAAGLRRESLRYTAGLCCSGYAERYWRVAEGG